MRGKEIRPAENIRASRPVCTSDHYTGRRTQWTTRALSRPLTTRLDNFTFSPAQITVPAGTRVTWTNRDDIPHTVTDSGNPRAMKSPPLDTGETFAFTFDKPGDYRYFCSLHPHMQGTVVVEEARGKNS